MSKLMTAAHPHIHSKYSAREYMMDVIIALVPLTILAILMPGLYARYILDASINDSLNVGLKALLVVLVGVGSAVIADALWAYFVKKEKSLIGLIRFLSKSYPVITGILFVLVIPINTPLYIVAIGSAVAIIIGKAIYGGVGQNIFNPALVGRAFVGVAWTSSLTYEIIDGTSTPTPLGFLQQNASLVSYDQIVDKYGSFWNLLLGLYTGSLGEMLSIFIIICFIYLLVRKTINWYIPTIYVGIVFFMTWGIALLNGIDGPTGIALYYPTFHVLTGGLLIGAVFMATEPVTSPMTKRGKMVFATYLGIITVLIRILGNLPEGVLYSILFMNLFVPIIDNAYLGQDKGIKWKERVFWIFTLVLIVGLTFYMASQVGGAA